MIDDTPSICQAYSSRYKRGYVTLNFHGWNLLLLSDQGYNYTRWSKYRDINLPTTSQKASEIDKLFIYPTLQDMADAGKRMEDVQLPCYRKYLGPDAVLDNLLSYAALAYYKNVRKNSDIIMQMWQDSKGYGLFPSM